MLKRTRLWLNNREVYLVITKNKKIKKIIILLIPIILLIIYIFGCRLLFVPREPSVELERALEFERSKNSVGITFEECEQIFGELGVFPESHVVVVPAGYFQYQGFFADTVQYELYIYFDDSRCVKKVMLRTISEV